MKIDRIGGTGLIGVLVVDLEARRHDSVPASPHSSVITEGLSEALEGTAVVICEGYLRNYRSRRRPSSAIHTPATSTPSWRSGRWSPTTMRAPAHDLRPVDPPVAEPRERTMNTTAEAAFVPQFLDGSARAAA